ncbi:MAG: CsgG/HfaB family protein [Halanaerobium sp.]
MTNADKKKPRENNKTQLILFILILFISLIFIAVSAAAQTQEEIENMSAAEAEELMAEILKSSSEIMASSPNVTIATQLLAALPEREDKPAVAVYRITDRTGQVKNNTGSAVVTQGATDMMITALKRSRQFKVLDRTNFGDFMNEQNLKTNERLAFDQGPDIGEMTGANYIIEGSITEYQVDRSTGGVGLNIGGVGGNREYAKATTAVDIRLLDSTTGEVIWSESLKGEIEGKKVGLQAFSFMGNNIVEFETGQGKQEVINLVIRTLLEESVYKIYESGLI